MSINPSVIDTPPELPLPSIITLPVPFGNNDILPFDVDTRSLPFTSRSPPSCGVVSSDTFDIAAEDANPDTTADRAIFLRPPPEVSTAKNTS